MEGNACKCAQRKKPIDKRRWVILDYRCNHSAFSGYHYTPSDYSAIRCLCCGKIWRTKAAYVDSLDHAKGDELTMNNDWDESDRERPPCEGGDSEEECCALAQDCEMTEDENDDKPNCFSRPPKALCGECSWETECTEASDAGN